MELGEYVAESPHRRAAKYLGIRLAETPLAWLEAAERGLPIARLESLVRLVAPGDANLKYRIVKKATYARRKGAKPALLSKEESERLIRLARVFALSEDVWGGGEGAVRFLQASHVMLEGRTPLEVTLSGEMGAKLVEEILGRLAYGTAV